MSESAALPVLRDDLSLFPGEPDEYGEPTWILFDPLANKHFRLGESRVELLGLMDSRSVNDMRARAAQLMDEEVTAEDIEELVRFLRVNNLVVADDAQIRWYHKQLELTRAGAGGAFGRIIRTPIFFRIPLWNPDRFLDRTLPYVRWLGSRLSLQVIALCGLVGLLMITQQFETFVNTFLHFFNAEGLALYLLTLIIVKIFHELGHAYVAKSLGCRVPVIGVAFIVGWPVLYTDTTDAWKVSSRGKKLQIGIAGISVEVAIACLSLLLWNVLDDGPLRSATFLLATTTWLVSILININPLMRFDGYYLFSDWLRIPNLEPRAFEMGRWFLREKLFALGEPAPEPYQRRLVVFAFAVWIYRFFLFLGIALIVYQFMFKAAGILLFVLEIAYFIGRPIVREIGVWWSHRDRIGWNRNTLLTVCLALACLVIFLVPWKSTLSMPAYVIGTYSPVYLTEPARLVELAPAGTFVDEGDVVARLDLPGLDQEINQSRIKVEELTRSSSFSVFDPELRTQALVVDSELRTELQKLASLRRQRERLTLTAPANGQLVDHAESIDPGDWLPNGFKLTAVIDASDTKVQAYVREEDLFRLAPGQIGRFYPEHPGHQPIDVTVDSIDAAATRELDQLYLASLFGGDIAVRETDDGRLPTVHGIYRVTLTLDAAVYGQVVRGNAVVFGESHSLAGRLYQSALSLLIREGNM